MNIKHFHFLFLICIFINSNCKISEKHSRIKIFFTEENNIQELSKLGIPIDHGEIKINVYIVSEYSSKEIKKIKKAGFNYEILIDDMKKYYRDQNKKESNDEKY